MAAARKRDVRAVAALALADVLRHGRSLSGVMPERQAQVEERDRALLQEICYGVLRHLPRLQALVDALVSKPFKAKDSDVRCLLLAGLYQLIYMRVPDHAAVSGTVAAVKALKKEWARGVVNGVLRNFQRRADELLAEADASEAVRAALPEWLLQRLQRAYPDQWQAVAQAANDHAPMTLRVNANRCSRDDYLERLAEAGVGARPCLYSEVGVVLERPVDVAALPGFAEGWVSVQDEAAQLAAALLAPQAGERVLDACAAPGGKSAHLLELCNGELDLTAVDSEEGRLERLHDTLTRLGYEARVAVADASQPAHWWDEQCFDRILLDAPCSATGVIRRHPDIKWLRRDEDIAALAALQERILAALWPTLKPGGLMLYATCSILPQENSGRIEKFLAAHPDAVELPLTAEWGRAELHGRQLLPGEAGMDGFYYALIQKR